MCCSKIEFSKMQTGSRRCKFPHKASHDDVTGPLFGVPSDVSRGRAL